MIQLQMLNKLLQDKDKSVIILNNLTDEYFSDYKNEFNFILNHIHNYNTIPDKASFLSVFTDFDLIEVNESYNYLIDALIEDRNKRLLAKTFNSIRDLINKNKTAEAMQLYSTAFKDIVQAVHLDSFDIVHNTDRYNDYVDRCSDFNKYYIKTGFNELDELIGGWDKNEELATIVARPGIGKSWVLLKCAIAAMTQGLTVGIYSGEMSERKVGYRFDTLVSHISNKCIMQGNAVIQNEYKLFLDNLATKYKGTIKVLTPAMINGAATITSLQAFIEKESLDILCIDQHSLLEDERRAKSPFEKAANISRDLKNLQTIKKIPIIAVSQQNRDSTESGPSTANVAQSDRISQDSTVVIFLEQASGILTLNLVKCRDAEAGKRLKYGCDFDKGIFTYIPIETDALNGGKCEQLKEEYEDITDEEDSF